MTRFLAIFLLVAAPGSLFADQPIDFNREIRSILFENCVTCHGPDEEERAAGLRLDVSEGATEDLGGYAAIVPGKADESELILRIRSDDEDLRMPPPEHGRGLIPEQVELLERWINQGAAYDKHWSYQPPRFANLPKVKDTGWPVNGIDHFVLARLEAEGLQPAEPADRLTIARRVAMDLTGLPPTWEEAEAFANDTSPDAYERFVQTQLDKPAFGERWARVWLDLARYADSAGYADDPPRTIWAFRDYVIRSLNENKPFDQFTIEQIAGDLLDQPSEDQLIATAFHRNTLTNNEGGTNDEEFRNVAVVDRVNTTMAVWMGTTMACAQCHTHKYDPITHEEYFRFFALLNNTEDSDKRDERPRLDLFSEDQKQRRSEIQKREAELREILDTQTPELTEGLQQWLAELGAEPSWEAVTPTLAESAERSLSIAEDGLVVAEGEPVVNASDVIEIPTADQPIYGIQIEVPAQERNFVLSQVTAEWNALDEASAEARFVRLTVPGKQRILHVAEIEVFRDGENLARNGKASASSTDYGGPPKRIIDGNTDGTFSANTTNHTKKENAPWVEIDLGSTQTIDQVVVWNRTDGGKSIQSRLDGFQIELLSEDRSVVWKQTPKARALAKYALDVSGHHIDFAQAFADFEQSGFPAASVLTHPLDAKKGWAVAPQTGKRHTLTLVPAAPLKLGEGVLQLRLKQTSEHKNHTIGQFRVHVSSDENLSRWAAIPPKILKLVRREAGQWNEGQRGEVEAYFRSTTPLLAEQRDELDRIGKEYAGIKPFTTVPVLRELPDDKTRMTHIQIRGNYLSKGEQVDRGTPAVFHPLTGGERPSRMDLARWLISPDNPLTARVIANRHWEQLFGIGIVETSEEFGSQGELPSHPELLDWLAIELQTGGWDLKQLIKTIVMSATYRQSSVATHTLQSSDPFNRLLARGPRFRISAEMVRDQALYVSGLLSQKLYGPPVKPMQPSLGLKAAFGSATDWKTSTGDDRYRRGLYTTWRRSSPYPSMAQFDAPNREVCTVRRIRTNTPLQALVTLNDPVYVEAAQALARKLIVHSEDPAERIELAFRRALIRDPNPRETERLIALAEQAASTFASAPEDAVKMATDPLGPLPESADAVEHAAWTVVANVILNLDEVFLKR